MSETKNYIPEMTNPLGKYWGQPDRNDITFIDGGVQMSQQTFDRLKEYSTSTPTGAYEGKMWKRDIGDGWLLCWFALIEENIHDAYHIETRHIIITDHEEETCMMEIPLPIGDFIIKNAEGIMLTDGMYYHYTEVVDLLRKYQKKIKQ